ncbi:guanylate cyclase 32E-like, partial [Saccoglossus kowalevskii]
LGRTGAAYFIALEKVNSDDSLLPGHRLVYTRYDSEGYDIETIRAILNFTETEKYAAFFGPVYSVEAEPIGKLAMVWNTPYMCSSCPDDMFAIKNFRFETMIRTFGTFGQLGGFVKAIAEKFNWDRFAVLLELNTKARLNLFSQPVMSIRNVAMKNNLTIAEFVNFNESTDTVTMMRDVSKIAR